jgi:aminoglycoside 6'-N-acetyltransferase I
MYTTVQRALNIRQTTDTADADWLSLRAEFIPGLSLSENREFLETFAHGSREFVAFVASDGQQRAMGFAEVCIRKDYVNGCRHRPTLFLEGIYVRPAFRGRGVARALCTAAENWGRYHGCREFASDVYIDDAGSVAAHIRLGFRETERVVYFRKPLGKE